MIRSIIILDGKGEVKFRKDLGLYKPKRSHLTRLRKKVPKLEEDKPIDEMKTIRLGGLHYHFRGIQDHWLTFVTDLADNAQDIEQPMDSVYLTLYDIYLKPLVESYWSNTEPIYDKFISVLDDLLELELKICLLGEGGVGKSTILRLLADREPNKTHIPTLGVDIEKIPSLKIGPYNITIWDFAGQERLTRLWKLYIEDTDFALLVCDSTMETILRLRSIVDTVREFSKTCPIYVIANKQDLPHKIKPNKVESLVGYKTIGLVAIDKTYRQKLVNFIEEIIETHMIQSGESED